MTGRTLWWTRWGKELADRCSLTMSLSGASASAAAKQRHQEQRRADTSALVDAARGQRQMPELPPYVPEFDLAFMSQMLGGGAVRPEPEDPATGDDEAMMQEAAVDIALQLFTDDGGLQRVWRCEGRPPLPHHFVCVEKFTLPYLGTDRVTVQNLDLTICAIWYISVPSRGSCDPAEWTGALGGWRGVPPSTRRGRSCLCASWGGTKLSPTETTRRR